MVEASQSNEGFARVTGFCYGEFRHQQSDGERIMKCSDMELADLVLGQ